MKQWKASTEYANRIKAKNILWYQLSCADIAIDYSNLYKKKDILLDSMLQYWRIHWLSTDYANCNSYAGTVLFFYFFASTIRKDVGCEQLHYLALANTIQLQCNIVRSVCYGTHGQKIRYSAIIMRKKSMSQYVNIILHSYFLEISLTN